MQQLRQYLVPISESRPNETPIYRHPKSINGFQLPKDPQKINMQQQLLIQFNKFLQKNTLGEFNEEKQEYNYLTYENVLKTATLLGSSLSKLGIQKVCDKQNNEIYPVGIYLSNRREWTLIDIACILYGFTSCPFYDTLGSESITYALNTTQASICFVQNSTIKYLCETNLPYLKTIVLVGDIDKTFIEKLNLLNKNTITFQEFLLQSQNAIELYPEIQPNVPLTLIFTSGTTGQPKAAVQTHYNFITMLALFEHQDHFEFKQDDVYLSYLPLPHTFERVVHLAALSGGAELNYFSGNIQNIARDIQRCRPTFFCSVPRMYNRFYEGIQTQMNQVPKEMKEQFFQVVSMKQQYMKKTGQFTHQEFDKAFIKTKALLGGRQRIMITGAAPISPVILDFLKCTLCCQIIMGYGQTETNAASFLSDYYDLDSEHIGGPTTSQEFKLVSVPDMGYLVDEKINDTIRIRGEVCMRGPSVIKSYFNNPEQTKETVDEEGWIHTGDIGQIINGKVILIDRKKNLFKLSQGEYVSPEKVENCYLRVKGICEIVIFGDSLQNYCVGVVVPEPTFIQQIGTQLGIQGSHEELCKNKQLSKHILSLLIEQGKNDSLNGYEQVVNIYLESKPFAQVGILTETMKMQRHKAKQHYLEVIQALYQQIQE